MFLTTFDYEDVMTHANATVTTNDTGLHVTFPRDTLPETPDDDGTAVAAFIVGDNSSFIVNQTINTNTDNENHHVTLDVPVPEQSPTNLQPGDTVDVWIAAQSNLDSGQSNNHQLQFGTDAQQPPDNDFTNGTWLYVKTYDLHYKPNEALLSGRVHLPAPIRNYIDLNQNTEYTFKATHNTKTDQFTASLIDGGDGVTIPKSTREAIDLSETNRTVDLWLHTPSIVNTDQPDTNNSITATKNQDTDKTPPTQEPTTESEITLSLADQINPEYNADLTPVVLLDDDERLQEQWTGHYITNDNELLCEKPFTNAVPDPERKHYTEICIECALERPGALPDADLAELLNEYTDISFSPELPFMLDREDAAILLATMEQLHQSNHAYETQSH